MAEFISKNFGLVDIQIYDVELRGKTLEVLWTSNGIGFGSCYLLLKSRKMVVKNVS